MVGPDHLTQFLGIEARRQRRRIGEVAKEDRELAPLGFDACVGRNRRFRRRRRGRRSVAERLDRIEQSAAMPDRDDA